MDIKLGIFIKGNGWKTFTKNTLKIVWLSQNPNKAWINDINQGVFNRN